MTKTKEQKKLDDDYKKYTKGIRTNYRNNIRAVEDLRASIIKRARDAPAGQKNIIRNKLLKENEKALNIPK